MKKDIDEIRETLKTILIKHLGPLKVKKDLPGNFELSGTIKAPQGKQVVDGIYFSSVMPKAKDVRFYFYPSYTHPQAFEDLSEQMTKFKKGKSCFHVKHLDDALEAEIDDMVAKAVKTYQEEGWLAK